MNAFRIALGGLLVIMVLSACGGVAASGSPGDASTSRGPTAVPGDPGSGSGSSGSGGSGVGSGGTVGGVDVPPPNRVPGDDGATIVLPQPGQLDPNPVSVSGLIVKTDGRHVTVRLAWTSGVEPCYVLDSVKVATEGNTITLTVLEGHGPGDNVCIEIAVLKATIVDLGELEPGTWVIQALPGDAAPQTIDID
jgi:hypothetical protein